MTNEESIIQLKDLMDFEKSLPQGDGNLADIDAINMAIRSLEADRKIEKILYDIRNEITMLFIFTREPVIEIIDKHLKEVEDDTGRA